MPKTLEIDIASTSTPTIGAKIKVFRDQKKMSLRELSEMVGVSSSFLSQVERDQVMLSINTLKKIAEALEVLPSSLIDDASPRNPVVRHDNRTRIALPGSDMDLESLTPGFNHRMQVLYAKAKPGQESNREFLSHPSDEFILVVTGTLEVKVDKEIYVLNKGDSILFDAIHLHKFRVLGDSPTEYIVIDTPPVL
jgi:transcriptional regulator with XRE-family HTH domain